MAGGGKIQKRTGPSEIHHIHPIGMQQFNDFGGQFYRIDGIIKKKTEIDVALRISLSRNPRSEEQPQLQPRILKKRSEALYYFCRRKILERHYDLFSHRGIPKTTCNRGINGTISPRHIEINPQFIPTHVGNTSSGVMGADPLTGDRRMQKGRLQASV